MIGETICPLGHLFTPHVGHPLKADGSFWCPACLHATWESRGLRIAQLLKLTSRLQGFESKLRDLLEEFES